MISRTIFFGDIHGCIDELMESLDSMNFDPAGDRLIFVGDLVDRGPDSGAVVRFVKNNKYECVCGNHDNKHIRYFKHEQRKISNPQYKNPINFSEDKKRTHAMLSKEDILWLSELPKSIHIKQENYLVVHAGVVPNFNPLKQSNDVYMYCRYLNKDTYRMMSLGSDLKQPANSVLWADVYNGDLNIIYGHNIHNMNFPHITVNRKGAKTFGLDTGCVFGGKLTALILKDGYVNFHQTAAKKNYYKK